MNEAEPKTDLHPKKVGERMAEARTAMGLELEDIAERTRIPLRHLQAIEASDFDQLPATTYSAGFVKTYARLIGLDAEEISSDFRAERGETTGLRAEYTPFEPADPSRVPPRLLAMIALATAIILGIAYMGWRGTNNVDAERQIAAGTAPDAQASTPAATPAPKPVTQPVLPPAPSPTDVVTLTATDAVWIKVSEKDGPTLFMGELAAGKTYTVPADAKDPRLLTGRPQAVRATVGSRVIPALGTGKKSISNVGLKGPDLIAWSEANPLPPPEPSAAAPAPPAPTPNTDAPINGDVATPSAD